jgi:hypothetical protein
MTEEQSAEIAVSGTRVRQLGRALTAIGIILWELINFAVKRRSRYFMRLCARCHVACMFEVWSKISDGPLDSESRSYKDADAAITYYLMRSSTARQNFASAEITILSWNFLAWHRAQTDPPNARKHFNFVRKHRLAKIIRYYENLQNYISYVATTEIASYQELLKEPLSCEEWKSKVKFNRLPPEFKDKPHRARRLASFLAKKLRSLKREIAIKNYLKIDFALSDITSFIAISGALLLLLGFGRVAFLGWYFEIPFARYFGTTDYIASGLGEIYAYLFAAFFAAGLSFYRLAAATAISLQGPDFYRQSWSGRFEKWTVHLTAVSACVALVLVGVQFHWVDTISLAFVLSYLIPLVVWNVSLRFFKDPLKAGLLLAMVLVSAAITFVGTINEIQRITRASANAHPRTIQFNDSAFNEPAWKILAITNNFVILRRQSDGIVLAKARADLKSIEDRAPLTPVHATP